MNYYQAVEKKPEHGGGWVFMCLNRRTGAYVVCQCKDGPEHGFAAPGHSSALEASRCFWRAELAKPLFRGMRLVPEGDRAPMCQRCRREPTTQTLRTGTGLLFDGLVVCETCAPRNRDDKARKVLAKLRPVSREITIQASW